MKLRIGTGLPNIQKKDLAEFKVIIPAIEQQRTISNILSLLERKTEIEGRMLIAMRTEKQYLLHQMFICLFNEVFDEGNQSDKRIC